MTRLPTPGAQERGRSAEDFVLAFLERAGLRCLMRNYRCRWGEIDLIMLDGNDCVVFVEVRYRSATSPGQGFGDALDSIGERKRTRLVRAAAHFLGDSPQHIAARTCRFDVVALDAPIDSHVRWLKAAFDAD